MAQEVLGPHANAAYRDYAQDIHASGRHLLALADDILDLARIETGHRQVLETAVNLGALAQDCAHMMRLGAAERDITLIVTLNARPRLWRRTRGAPDGAEPDGQRGEIHARRRHRRVVRGQRCGGRALLRGGRQRAGLADAELPLALSAHHRESRLDPASGQGAGLGLAIVRALAQMHEARWI